MSFCDAIINDKLCGKIANRTGKCNSCSMNAPLLPAPVEPKKPTKEMIRQRQEQARKEIAKMQANEIRQGMILDAALETLDLEGLRRLELRILADLMDPEGQIDVKASNAIVNLLRHQEELIKQTEKLKPKIDANEREAMIRLASQQSVEENLRLLNDFHGEAVKNLHARAREDVIEAEFKVIEGKNVRE